MPRPRSSNRAEPVHLLVDSTRLKLCGVGEWLIEKHGTKTRRAWRKLHIRLNAETGEIVAADLTTNDMDDASRVGSLLGRVAGPVASFTGDGAYDQDGVYRAVADHQPEAAVIVPPHATTVPSATAASEPTQRDRHLQGIAEKGRIGWQKMSGYNKRAALRPPSGATSRLSVTGCARARISVGRPRSASPSIPEPDAGVGTPGLRPRRMNTDGVAEGSTYPSIHATTPWWL
jgi:hypothetical protein